MTATGRFIRRLLSAGGFISWEDDHQPDSLPMLFTAAACLVAFLALVAGSLIHATIAIAAVGS